MYSPRQIYKFLNSNELHSIINESFHKRHMEDDEKKSPFDNPESIMFLEWLIDHNYIIALYRGDHGKDTETYLISTLGHAFMKNYKTSRHFQIRAHYHFYKTLYWILFASVIGSLIGNIITLYFI